MLCLWDCRWSGYVVIMKFIIAGMGPRFALRRRDAWDGCYCSVHVLSFVWSVPRLPFAAHVQLFSSPHPSVRLSKCVCMKFPLFSSHHPFFCHQFFLYDMHHPSFYPISFDFKALVLNETLDKAYVIHFIGEPVRSGEKARRVRSKEGGELKGHLNFEALIITVETSWYYEICSMRSVFIWSYWVR